MMLALHRHSGMPVWVNSDHIVTFAAEGYAPHPAVLTVFGLVNGDTLTVQETPADILALLGLPGGTDAKGMEGR